MATAAQARRALDFFEQELTTRRNVVGLGIVPADEASPGKEMAVAVYVKKKLSLEKLRGREIIPKELCLPGRGGAVSIPTRVIEEGEIALE